MSGQSKKAGGTQAGRTQGATTPRGEPRSGGPVRVYQYAACGTCKKALKWLGAHGVAYESVPIVERPPSLAELTELVARSGLPARKWINTSGGSYRALVQSRGKEAVEELAERELLTLLAADGKMIKRPVVIAGDHVLVGFGEAAYEACFSPAGGR